LIPTLDKQEPGNQANKNRDYFYIFSAEQLVTLHRALLFPPTHNQQY
jgi:hypothetical protein